MSLDARERDMRTDVRQVEGVRAPNSKRRTPLVQLGIDKMKGRHQ
jgi:hypothetical protein